MKKLYKRIIAFLTSLLMLCSVACGKKDVSLEATTTTAPETDAEETVPLDKTAEYFIACTNSDTSITKAAEDLGANLELATGLEYSVHTEKSGGKIYPEPVAAKEIFVGISEREAYASVYDGLKYGEWRIKVIDGSIVISGSNVGATLDAVEYFTANFVTGKKNIEIAVDYEYTYDITNYPVSSVKLGGVELSEYSVIYKSGSNMAVQAANDLAYDIGTASGIVLPMLTASKNMDVSRSIVVGQTLDHVPVTENYGDSKVYVDGTTVYVDGKDIVGLERGITYLSTLFTKNSETVDVSLDTISHTGALQSREDYINDATAFVPCYNGRIETDTEKLSLSYKITQLNKVDGEVLVIAHRGEHTYYPENSLEGIISAWRMGLFSTELDIHKTKDGYWIAMHDETVSRITNVNEARAANSKLPTSDYISDWTLAEIRELRLKDAYGVVTPFLIPTLEEALTACNGRIFLHLDKTFDFNEDILPLMVKTDAFECVYLCNNVGDPLSIIENVKATYGKTLYTLMRTNVTSATSAISELRSQLKSVKNSNGAISPASVFLGDFVKSSQNYNEQIRDIFSKDLRVATWVLREADYEFVWRKARSFNYSIFLTDHPYEVTQKIM